ncbi:MAG: hypothetical protein JWL81_248, partial [Verrucomicrobiales bacterium]|nr:hypothetical protein [Verrucomicrobiales bacterium]
KPFGRSRGQRSFPSEERSKGSPEWNQYRITCQDGTLRLAVNGKEVSGGSECTWRKGYIALESEGGVVDWRNLRIQELPGTAATPEQTAPLAESDLSIYNGRNLLGWTASTGQSAPTWRAGDWELTGNGTSGTLTLDQKPGDFRFQFDVRAEDQSAPPAADANSAAEAKPASDSPLPVLLNGQPLPGKLTGKWTRYIVKRTGTQVEICQEATGKEAPSANTFTVPAGPSEISLKSAIPVRLASLYLRQ